MVQTALFKEILKKAHEVKDEFNAEYLTASHIAVAVADFCAIRYTGHTPVQLQSSVRFEEERLRYIFSKEVRVASHLRKKLFYNAKSGVQEQVFDVGCCEQIAALRKSNLLTADILLLSALKELDNAYRVVVRNKVSDDSILAALQNADENIYDFVIEKIEQICSELKEKSDEAKAIRNWKPAAKFAEPEDLLKQFFDNICATYKSNVLYITIPSFLRGTDLKLSIYKVKDHYIVHDNGCAVENLLKRIDSIRLQKVLDLLWGETNLQGHKLFAQITDVKFVLYFIQEVILTANADSYYENFNEEDLGRRRYIDLCEDFEAEQQAEDFDADAFLEALKETATAYYDENKGLTLRFDVKYNRCSYAMRVLIETMDDGTLRFSDAYKNKQYETGEMLEAFYFGSDKQEEAMYYQVMQELANPFGMVFDMTSSISFPEYGWRKHNHKNPYMLSTADHWVRNLYKFMNSAVLISVVADRINYEKVREW